MKNKRGLTITGMQILGTDMSMLFNREFNAGEGLENEVEDVEAVVVDVPNNDKLLRFKLTKSGVVFDKEIEISEPFHPVEFGRWLLKHCEPAWVDGMLTWKCGEHYVDTLYLYKMFEIKKATNPLL